MTKECREIFQLIEEWSPKDLAYDWDNVGLQLGSPRKKVKKVMVTLDVLESVVDEAVDKGADLIIAHHPILFKPLSEIDMETPKGKAIKKLIQHDISVYAAHTNLDVASGGVNDLLCEALHIHPEEVLVETGKERLMKVAVYVPKAQLEDIRKAFHQAGAGHIGDYSHCSFQTDGEGTFKPLEGTNPYIGSENKLEVVHEVRVDTIVPEGKVKEVIHNVIEAHPYEEPAYDIYPLENPGKSIGIGRVGHFEREMSLRELSEKVKHAFGLEKLRVTGDLDAKVKKAAVLGGSGEKYIHAAKVKGADVYITGDMSFHMAQDAMEMGLSVIDPGHYIESVMKEAMKHYLDKGLNKENIDIFVSQVDTDPFQFI
ncbi:Nif3-like dinuclear metal center hexameric protein [Virgibacillus xinjiangensis]|uniref:GTP cyclohydrolase 1 type 2 homolog n=1 Tax=Virgibacillus xinjiangensis TaxID=393090 RepID=A0ABV7CRN8_9BACI